MFKQPKWFDQIRNEINKQDKDCYDKDEMVADITDPYKYRTFKEFIAANPGGKCKTSNLKTNEVLKKNGMLPEPETDNLKRYYKNYSDWLDCEFHAKGRWYSKSTNRQNKVGKGVCWTDKQEAMCGDITAKGNCEKQGCAWDDTMTDCMSKDAAQRLDVERNKIQSVGNAVLYPPNDMPSRFTTVNGIQKYLHNWYNNKLPEISPETDELIGKGNRCVQIEKKIEDNSQVKWKKKWIYKKEDFMRLPEHLTKLQKDIITIAVGIPNDKYIIDLYNQLENSNVKVIIEGKIKEFWETVELYIGVEDLESYENFYGIHIAQNWWNVKDNHLKLNPTGFLPSIPQSVINMLMKKIVMSKSSNRGLLAWHSTGSGKTCTAAGVMDAFWDTKRQIVFASSIDAIASNPDFKFHECASRLFPRFQMAPFNGNLEVIADMFEKRGIIFLSFAKLSNRLRKWEELKSKLKPFFNSCTDGKYIDTPAPASSPKKHVLTLPKKKPDNEAVVPLKKIEHVLPLPKKKLDSEAVMPLKKLENVLPLPKKKLDSEAVMPLKKLALAPKKKSVSTGSDSEVEAVVPLKKAPKKKSVSSGSDSEVEAVVPLRKAVKKKSASSGSDSELESIVPLRKRALEPKKTASSDSDSEVAPSSKKRAVFENDIEFYSPIPLSKVTLRSIPDSSDDEKPLNLRKKVIYGGGGRPGSPFENFLRRIAVWYRIKDINVIRTACRELGVKDQRGVVDLDNAVVIVDEVHNLFRPLDTQRALHASVEEELVNVHRHKNLKLVILSATPGDNITDIIKLLNCIRDPSSDVMPIEAPNIDNQYSMEKFRNSIKGLISYFDMSSDHTKFPKVIENKPMRLPISKAQFDKYIESFKGMKEEAKNYDELSKKNILSKFWQKPRKYANMMYTFEKNMSVSEFSSKLPALIKNVMSYPDEKHYIYSAFHTAHGSGQGILEIARQFDAKGYKKMTVSEALKKYEKLNVHDNDEETPTFLGPPRYILALQNDLAKYGSGDVGENLRNLLNLYNSPANKTGELIHVMLASQSFNEGIDLKAVRHIHIFEPLVTMASDYQTIGRARRFCSHAQLDKKDWEVNIHRYFIDEPKTTKKDAPITNFMNIDDFVNEEAKSRMRALLTIHHVMKEAAVDCMLLKEFHNDSTIKCTDKIA